MDKCPICNTPLEATVKVYLSGVRFTAGPDSPALTVLVGEDDSRHIGVEVDVYCENDHEQEWPAGTLSAVVFDGKRYQT